jgi:hypothetical protein
VKPIHDFSTHKSIYIYKSYSGDLLLLVTGLGSPSAFGQALGDGDGEREVICIHIYIICINK